MSTSEALRFLGLDFYATASDIKSAYRRLAMNLRPDPAMSDGATLRVAEEGMQRLNRAYAALLHRVDNTPPEDLLQDAGAGAKVAMRLPKLAVPQIALPRLVLPKMALPAFGRVSAVTVVMVAVGYGIVHGVAQKQMTPGVVDAQTVAAPQAEPVALSRPVEEVVKPGPVQDSTPRAAAAPEAVAAPETPQRELRTPALPGLNAEDAKAITDTCRAETDDAADNGQSSEDFRACVLRTAQATPRPIHLD